MRAIQESEVEDALKFRVTSGKSKRVEAILGWILIALGVAFCLWRTDDATHRDFANLYAGAVCLVHNCDPYDMPVLEKVLVDRGYPMDSPSTSIPPPMMLLSTEPERWMGLIPIYPVTSLALMTPFEPLSLLTAAKIFYVLSFVSLVIAAYVVFVRSSVLGAVSPVVRGLIIAGMLVSPSIAWTLRVGNPTLIVISWMMICIFVTDSDQWRLRVVLLALSCILKPQIAVPMACAYLFRRHIAWKELRLSAIFVCIFGVFALAWAYSQPMTRHWFQGMTANIQLASSKYNSMEMTEHAWMFGTIINLRYLVGYWVSSVRLQAAITYSVLAVLVFFLAVSVYRLRKQGAMHDDQFLLGLGCLAAITLLLTYHRFYDTHLLFFAVPWALRSLALRQHRAAAITTLLLLLATCAMWVRRIPESIRGLNGFDQPVTLFNFFTHRTIAIEIVVLTVVLLITLHKEVETSGPSPVAEDALS